MSSRDQVDSPEEQRERVSQLYRTHGMVQPSERVWRGGVDVTHEPPSTWPWPYSMYVSGARGEEQRRLYLHWHEEAAAGRLV